MMDKVEELSVLLQEEKAVVERIEDGMRVDEVGS